MTRPSVALAICVTSAVAAQIFLKAGLNRYGVIDMVAPTSLLVLARQPLVLTGAGFYLITVLSWLVALSHVDLSVAYPVLTLSVVGVAWASAAFLGEPISVRRVIGTVFTLAGVWLIIRS